MDKSNYIFSVFGLVAILLFKGPHEANASRKLASLLGHSTGSPISWRISGSSNSFGPYSGELRLSSIRPDGTRLVVREIQFQNYRSHDKSVAELWDGVASHSNDPKFPGWKIQFELKRVNFVSSISGISLDVSNKIPLSMQANVAEDFSDNTLVWAAVGEKDYLSASTPMQSEPVAGKKTELKIASRPVFGMNTLVDIVAGRYFSDSFVKKFMGKKEFEEGIQYSLYDYTNFDFYQKKPETLRVVDQLISPASLEEESFRYAAYAPSLSEKAKHFDLEVPARDLDQFGMVAFPVFDKDGKIVDHNADYDSALWTGQYIASQFFRYQVTKESAALENIKRSAQALTTLVEISNDPKEFARALLPVGKKPDPANQGWVEGLGRFSSMQYNCLGNNDMIRGIIMGLLFANEVLPSSEAALKSEIEKSIKQLAEQSRVVKSKATHRLTAYGAAFLITGEEKYRKAYEDLATQFDTGLAAQVHFPKDVGGISDWSGNNLGIAQDVLRTYIAHRMNSKDATVALHSSYLDWKDIQNYRFAPYVFFLKGENSSRNPVDAEKLQEAVFILHEFPGSKPVNAFRIDHSISDDFTLSPYPSQPWKFIDKNRPVALGYQSLVSYPLFQSAALTSHWAWRESPFSFRADQDALQGYSGADYLFAYWMGRYYAVLTEND